MSIKNINQILALLVASLILSGCANFNQKYNRDFKHNTPLIKGDIRKQGKAEIAKTVELGPKPVSGEGKKLQKRKKISSEIRKNYLKFPNIYF